MINNTYDVNLYNVPRYLNGSIIPTVSKLFPTSKVTRSFIDEIKPGTKTCLFSINHPNLKKQILWFTLDGTTPTPTNGHRITSQGRLEISADMAIQARFSNQPGVQTEQFRLMMTQLTN